MMRKSEKTRLLIVKEAARLFNQQGYHGTSMQDIMKATGLTKGGIYGNFKKDGTDKKGVKEEIAVAAFKYAVATVNQSVRERTFVIDHPVDKLKAVVYYYKERILNPPVEGGCPILNTSIDADDNIPALRNHVLKALDYWHERVMATIIKGQESGSIRKEIIPKDFATLYIGMIEGAIMMSRIYKNMHPFNVMSQQLLEKIEQLRS